MSNPHRQRKIVTPQGTATVAIVHGSAADARRRDVSRTAVENQVGSHNIKVPDRKSHDQYLAGIVGGPFELP